MRLYLTNTKWMAMEKLYQIIQMGMTIGLMLSDMQRVRYQ